MANPKQKRSKSNIRTRRAVWKLRKVTLSTCPQCKRRRRPHYACANCGYYNGREAVKQKSAPVETTPKG